MANDSFSLYQSPKTYILVIEREVKVMPQTIPVKELQDVGEVFGPGCKSGDHVLFMTKNCYMDMLYEKLAEAEASLDADGGIPADEVFRRIRAKRA